MKKIVVSSFIFLLIFNISCHLKQVILFQESNNYIQKGNASWNYENGIWTGISSGGAGFLTTYKTYSNFIFEVDFMPDAKINSGIFIRCRTSEINPTDCYEFNIWDHHPNQDFRTGALVTKAKPLTHLHTIDQWNTYKIEAKGSKLRGWINGVMVVDILENHLVEGHIALQAAEIGKVQFRNIQLRKL